MPRSHPEIVLQKQCVDYLNAVVPQPPRGPFWTAINPVPGSSARLGKLAKDMGLRAGVPDLMFLYRGRLSVIELKSGKKKPSQSQLACHEAMKLAGAEIYAANSLNEFIKVLGRVVS